MGHNLISEMATCTDRMEITSSSSSSCGCVLSTVSSVVFGRFKFSHHGVSHVSMFIILFQSLSFFASIMPFHLGIV